MGLVAVAFGAMVVSLGLFALIVRFSLVQVRASEALVVYAPGREPQVSFKGRLVLPFQSHEVVDLSAKEIVLDRRGRSSLRCCDRLRADVVFAASLAVNPTAEDVLLAARALGAGRTCELLAVQERFATKLGAALAEVVLQVDYDALVSRRVEVADRFIDVVGRDLDGYTLREAHFREVAQTPIELLDRHDVHDAAAIRAVTERAALESERTRELREAVVRNENGAAVEAAARRVAATHAASGSRDDLAAAEARVEAMRDDLAEAEGLLAALRG